MTNGFTDEEICCFGTKLSISYANKIRTFVSLPTSRCRPEPMIPVGSSDDFSGRTAILSEIQVRHLDPHTFLTVEYRSHRHFGYCRFSLCLSKSLKVKASIKSPYIIDNDITDQLAREVHPEAGNVKVLRYKHFFTWQFALSSEHIHTRFFLPSAVNTLQEMVPIDRGCTQCPL